MSVLKNSLRAIAAACVLALPLVSFTAPADAAPRRNPAPFCLQPYSSNGPGGSPQQCNYTSYDHCLQVGAAVGGNCVANIDYRGSYARVNGTWAAR